MSSFKGNDLFGSGPHRFSVLPRGLWTQPAWRLGSLTDVGNAPLGSLELEIVVTGRLVSATEAGLWTLREAIAAEGQLSAGDGTLVDSGGRALSDMWMVEYAEADRVDRGRAWSVAYTARFIDFEVV